MRRALSLAERARGATSPNPMVGAVVVRDGVCVGEGHHGRCGEPHAEPIALAAAGEKARGSTLYVNLEPCSHVGRTPPCVDAILAAGVKRVVCAMIDPNPMVSGRGVARLRDAGVVVDVGLCEAESVRLNAAFVVAQRERRPLVTVKLATSLDGRIANAEGQSAWISGEEARAEVHQLRAHADAVLVGPGTLRAEAPPDRAWTGWAAPRAPASAGRHRSSTRRAPRAGALGHERRADLGRLQRRRPGGATRSACRARCEGARVAVVRRQDRRGGAPRRAL